jgi:hypothetical protein
MKMNVMRRWATLALALASVLLVVTPSMGAQAASVSTLTGQVTITGVPGSPSTNTAQASPIPTMNLTFQSGQPSDSVSGDVFAFTTTVPLTIVGGGSTTVCADTQTISGVGGGALGRFDRQSGHLTGLPLTVTVWHSLAPGPSSGMWGWIVCNNNNNPFTRVPIDVFDVVLSTATAGGAALDLAGNIRLVGTGTVSTGSFPGTPVTVTVNGALSPLPDRSVPTCVLVPDVLDHSRTQADQDIRAAGLIPQFSPDPGAGAYVVYQRPHAGTCVTSGSRVLVNLHAGPRP